MLDKPRHLWRNTTLMRRCSCEKNGYTRGSNATVRPKKSGLSQLQLATELEVQVRQYQRLEYGEQPFFSVNIKLGLKICRILQIDPYDLVLGDSNANRPAQLQSRPSGKKKRNFDFWNGRGVYSDPTANQALYNVSIEWTRMRRLAVRLRLKGEQPDPLLFTGIFRRLITDPLEELMDR